MQNFDNKQFSHPKKGKHVLEEAVKNKVASTFFPNFDTTGIIGKIDFSVAKRKESQIGQTLLFEEEYHDIQFFLWAEAKKGTKCDIYESLVQLILTIGKAKTFETYLPPLFLGALDAEKIAFIQYTSVSHIFYKSDFNWNVTPSDHNSKEFRELHEIIRTQLENDSQLYYYERDEKELREFIANNFVLGNAEHVKIQVSKSSFTAVYLKWLEAVKPTIDIDWDLAKKIGIVDADFFLADLLSKDNSSIKDSLFVLLRSNLYAIIRETKNELGLKTIHSVNFKDGQKSHKSFWAKYQRPPRKDFWQYIVERRDLLVPQDVRERKGSYFTPQIWVEKSQEYLTKVLGENWQDEYIIWDCCAGTGNMERGLINPYNVFASTLDKADVDVIRDQIHNGMNLLDSHVFQFDFLNDDFDSPKVPDELKKIIFDKEKRKKLLIYINPPYAEHSNRKQVTGSGQSRIFLAKETMIYGRYKNEYGASLRELFAQFLVRIYKELDGVVIGCFSTTKPLKGYNFEKFRELFKSELKSLFIVPANTFDNVKGSFPIGFHIWDTKSEFSFKSIVADVFDKFGWLIGKKKYSSPSKKALIINWLRNFYDNTDKQIGFLRMLGTDVQHDRDIFICNKLSKNDIKEKLYTTITTKNITEMCMYNAVRHIIKSSWINNRDHYYAPTEDYIKDEEFLGNLFIYFLFDNSNNIKSSDGVNHWIPFREIEVSARDRYESYEIITYLKGITISNEAKRVLEKGRELYCYYHAQSDSNPNASFYDIRLYFQKLNNKGRMNSKSDDERYTELLQALKISHDQLRQTILPKLYKYGILDDDQVLFVSEE